LIAEQVGSYSWWSLHRLGFRLIIEAQVLVNPVVEDEHELLDLVEECLILIIEINELGMLCFIYRFKIDFKLLLPFGFQVFKLPAIEKFFQFGLRYFLQFFEFLLL
jgi:hypothetical protein